METSATTRIERLSQVSTRRVIEPDVEVTGEFTKAQIVPDELLSIAGLDLELTREQRVKLAREEVAAQVRFAMLLETALISGFAYQLTVRADPTDARSIYALHEIGEESRHARLFSRLVDQLAPTQWNPFDSRMARRWRSAFLPLALRRPATLDACVLAGEEAVDVIQRLIGEHPDADEYLRATSRYHRFEEARHLAFAKTTVGERYRRTGWTDRWAVRWVAPFVVVAFFDLLVHPFVYSTVGLPPFRTWWRVRRLPERRALRQQTARSVLRPLLEAGALRTRGVPWAWRVAAGVDRRGRPKNP